MPRASSHVAQKLPLAETSVRILGSRQPKWSAARTREHISLSQDIAAIHRMDSKRFWLPPHTPAHTHTHTQLLHAAGRYIIIVNTHQRSGYIIKRDPYARCAKKDPGMDGARIISPGLKTGAGGGSAFSPLQLLSCSVPSEKGALPQRSVQVHGRKWPPSLRRVLMEGCYTANYREAK